MSKVNKTSNAFAIVKDEYEQMSDSLKSKDKSQVTLEDVWDKLTLIERMLESLKK